ncbi:hypothetical protein AAFM71_10785 [Chromobacterium violaceum]|uniref:hypothetical protein n=1 Tax=Chromobacterium violaceum TaxID=536 RepID=UPI001BEB402D|nr:hypothetical protein [Chromobacterium violaceum]MBT2868888.1 hypothetical protein [Chromobacterium violaceum]
MVIELDHVQPEQLLQNLAIPSCPGILDRLRALRDDSAPPGGAGLPGAGRGPVRGLARPSAIADGLRLSANSP